MMMRQLGLWGGLVIAIGCNGRLTIPGDPGTAGSVVVGAGSGSAGRRDFSVAGSPGVGGSGPVGGSSPGVAGLSSTAGNDTYGPGGSNSTGGRSFERGGSGGYDTVNPGTAGGEWGPATLGGLGKPCLPGDLVTEADGTPAKTQIQDLARCAEGLSCDADGKCAPTPDCPQGGKLCVVRHATLGTGGSGGTPGFAPGWAGSSPGGGSSLGGNGQIVYPAIDRSGVIAITASESKVYWVEYGTRDTLGNYQHDGALMAYAPDDGTTSIIASDLDGPIGVEVTTTHAYIYVDGARAVGTPIRAQLLRVPLAGGTAELVQDGALPSSFAAAGSRAFWSTDYSQPSQFIYSMTSAANAVPTEFVTGGGTALTIDGTDLYYRNASELTSTPIASSAPVGLGMTVGEYVLRDDSIFTLEALNSGGGMLSRAPKSGGEFLRVRALGAAYPTGLRRVGDRYFVEGYSSLYVGGWAYEMRNVITANFVGTDPPIRLLQRANRRTPVDHLWAATGNALYWSEGRAVYKQPIPTP